MLATYTTECPDCLNTIHPGDWIRGNPQGQWVHTSCPQPRPAGAVCPQCFMELPTTGICDCKEPA